MTLVRRWSAAFQPHHTGASRPRKSVLGVFPPEPGPQSATGIAMKLPGLTAGHRLRTAQSRASPHAIVQPNERPARRMAASTTPLTDIRTRLGITARTVHPQRPQKKDRPPRGGRSTRFADRADSLLGDPIRSDDDEGSSGRRGPTAPSWTARGRTTRRRGSWSHPPPKRKCQACCPTDRIFAQTPPIDGR